MVAGLATCAPGAAYASAATPGAAASKTVAYYGLRIRVPSSWPVFRLDRNPRACVRFNRHAVYLGTPGTGERCPAAAVLGRTEAILVAPAGGQQVLSLSTAAQPAGGSTLVRRAGGLTVTATWGARPGLIRTALGAVWNGPQARSAEAPSSFSNASGGVGVANTGPTGTSGPTGPTGLTGFRGSSSTYTGLGFDACQDPSPTQLNAWLASSYRAVGTYIGGANMGCSQPNLTPANLSAEVAAGWHLIPTYVGLQAPSNSCGCAAITPSRATAQGTAAAQDAVANAQAAGIGSGSPIYFDMEAYPQGGSITTTVLTFLSAWTTELHALGYRSGVYSSADSGIGDLVSATGGSYALPDDIWNADWNGQQSTASSKIPSSDWASHQRLHQYSGGHNETYGKVTINIDGDYVDGATVGSGGTVGPTGSSGPTGVSAPALTIAPQPDGSIKLNGSWTGASVAAWKVLGGATPSSLGSLSGPLTTGSVISHSAFPYFAEQAFDSTGNLLGTTPVTATPAHVAIYGHTLFAPSSGWVGVPVGCFTGASCQMTVTVASGNTVLARTKPERVSDGVSGLVYFALSAADRRLLGAAPHRRLPVTVSISDGSGARASGVLNLVSFTSSGRPPRSAVQGTTIKVVGLTDFVAGGGFGGILAGCVGAGPCRGAVTLSAGRTTIAQTGPEFMGANELSYLSFRLTQRGRSLLAAAPGRLLATRLRITNGADVATAQIALVRF
ncbi:MAG: DUF1906 domain-containing protein [Solirubrobacteraceae bacterium]